MMQMFKKKMRFGSLTRLGLIRSTNLNNIKKAIIINNLTKKLAK